MNNLGTPIIAYWDVEQSLDEEILSRVCDGLVSSKVLVLHITDLSPTSGPDTKFILKKLAGENIRIVLTSRPSDAEDMEPLGGLSKLYIEIDTLERAAFKELGRLSASGCTAGVSFEIKAESFEHIPAILRLCLESDINDVHFPIKRFGSKGGIFSPSSESVERLSREMDTLELDKLNITLHEPFLHEVFGGRSSDGWQGCQGGNTMVYISGGLDVTPCPILPLSIGNLRDQELMDIFSSGRRRITRESLTTAPGECASCPEVSGCRGGCRGRTLALCGTLDMRDPGCPVAGNAGLV